MPWTRCPTPPPAVAPARTLALLVAQSSGVVLSSCAHPRSTTLLAAAQDGCTPLHYAAYNARLAQATALLVAGASTDVKNAAGKSALEVAQEVKDNKMIDLITNGPPKPEEPAEEAAAE
jgi:hypothetical protein